MQYAIDYKKKIKNPKKNKKPSRIFKKSTKNPQKLEKTFLSIF
jgi:hypothetical protein